jgi:hypothetical protein
MPAFSLTQTRACHSPNPLPPPTTATAHPLLPPPLLTHRRVPNCLHTATTCSTGHHLEEGARLPPLGGGTQPALGGGGSTTATWRRDSTATTWRRGLDHRHLEEGLDSHHLLTPPTHTVGSASPLTLATTGHLSPDSGHRGLLHTVRDPTVVIPCFYAQTKCSSYV